MENKFLKTEDFMELSETGNWLVDELIYDPHFMSIGCFVKDRGNYYFLRYRGGQKSATEIHNRYNPANYDKAEYNHEFFMRGLEPRCGFTLPEIGRAITDAEFAELVQRRELTKDDISDEFMDTKGDLYSPKTRVSVVVKQIRINGNAISLESELREKGIEAFSSTAGRVNIRVK